MKAVRCFTVVTALLICGATVTHAAYLPPFKRIVKVINPAWKFIKQDASGSPQATGFNDASWSSIHLPHSFEIPYWRTNMATTPTIGWYRKHITVDPVWLSSGKRIFIEFEAAFPFGGFHELASHIQ